MSFPRSIIIFLLILPAFVFSVSDQGIHPDFEILPLRPGGLKPQVTGLEFLSNGDLLVLTHEPVRDNNYVPGKLFLIKNPSARLESEMELVELASGLKTAAGLLVMNRKTSMADAGEDEIYITEKHRLVQLLNLKGGGNI